MGTMSVNKNIPVMPTYTITLVEDMYKVVFYKDEVRMSGKQYSSSEGWKKVKTLEEAERIGRNWAPYQPRPAIQSTTQTHIIDSDGSYEAGWGEERNYDWREIQTPENQCLIVSWWAL